MVARHEEHRDPERMIVEGLGEPRPEVLGRRRIVEQIARAEHGVHTLAPRHVEDPADHVHTRPGQRLLGLLGKRSKPFPQVPVRRVQKPQHDVFGSSIRKAARNSRVTFGSWYRRLW